MYKLKAVLDPFAGSNARHCGLVLGHANAIEELRQVGIHRKLALMQC